MTTVRIKHSSFEKTALKPKPEQPMRWAVLKSTGQVFYIGDLDPSQNGNACGCQCPACGENLQAVNVDKDENHFRKANTRWKFFRHSSGHQRTACSFMVAKLAALQLLLNSGEVDLPPPKKLAAHHGLSGETYNSVAQGKRLVSRIDAHVWNDNQSATITLEDGRTVLVLLQACSKLSAESGIDGVITIRVNDPVVASWPPHQILEALKIDSDFSCWDKHWDDEALITEAQSRALALADEAMDYLPPELGSMDGLTISQKSETILHAKVKEILAKAGSFRAPACSQIVSRWMDEGTHKVSSIDIPSQYLTLSNVRLEEPMLGMVPDVKCTAHSSRNPSEKFTLLIEVAVTHRVDSIKKAKIKAQNLACIEIDLSRLTLKGRITLDQLRSSVIDTLDGKSWIFNPALSRMVTSRKQELEREDLDLRKRRELEQEKYEWLDDCSLDRLAEIFLSALKEHWHTKNPVSVDEDFLVLPEEIAERLIAHGFQGAADLLLIGEGGILSRINEIQELSFEMYPVSPKIGVTQMLLNPDLRQFITLGLLAVKAYPLKWGQSDGRRFNKLRSSVAKSLRREEMQFARPSIYDDLIGLLFPAMRDLLANPFGTRKAIEQQIKLRADAEKAQLAEIQRLVEIGLAKKRKEDEESRTVNQKIDDLLLSEHAIEWSPKVSEVSIESMLKQTAIVRLSNKYARSGIDVEEILKSACDARARGNSSRRWFHDQNLPNTGKAQMLLQVLKSAGLLP